MNTTENTASHAASMGSAKLTQEILSFLCLDNLGLTDGDKISTLQAGMAIGKFDGAHPEDNVKAFHFGLDILNDIVLKANSHNLTAASADKIVGLRFYRAITTRTINGREIFDTEDVVIVPTTSTGDFEDHLFPLYSHSRPCPRLCFDKSTKTILHTMFPNS